MYQAPQLAQNWPNLSRLVIFRYFLGRLVPGLKKTIAVSSFLLILYYFSGEYRWLAASSAVVCLRQSSFAPGAFF
jgi:hypothetical protein